MVPTFIQKVKQENSIHQNLAGDSRKAENGGGVDIR